MSVVPSKAPAATADSRVPWDQAPLGKYGVALYSQDRERAACRITVSIPFVYGIVPARTRAQLPEFVLDELPRFWRPFTNDIELRSWQMLTGDDLVDLDGRHYWIKDLDKPDGWERVTRKQWIHIERLCGIAPKDISPQSPHFRRVNATSSFGRRGAGGTFRGAITDTNEAPPIPQFINYTVGAPVAPKPSNHAAGPYLGADVAVHAIDIRGYEGVSNIFLTDWQPANGYSLVG